jgi:hypothetical protein
VRDANIIESKSFKLYLGSFTNTAFADVSDVQAHLRADLNEALWRGAPAMQSGVGVRVLLPEMFDREPIHEMDGLSLDRLDIECTRYTPAPELLRADHDEQPVTEVLTSNLLKSNCLVTGQPDWGSVQIAYSRAADRPGGAAAVPGEFSQPQRIPRAVRGAHLHGHPRTLPADEAGGVCPLHAPRRAGHQPVSHQLPAGAAEERAHGAAVGAPTPAAAQRTGAFCSLVAAVRLPAPQNPAVPAVQGTARRASPSSR